MQNLHVNFDLNLIINAFLIVGVKKSKGKARPRTGHEDPGREYR